MTEINRYHRVTPIDESDFEFYFNENKVTNDFLANYPFLLSLEQIKKEFKKNISVDLVILYLLSTVLYRQILKEKTQNYLKMVNLKF